MCYIYMELVEPDWCRVEIILALRRGGGISNDISSKSLRGGGVGSRKGGIDKASSANGGTSGDNDVVLFFCKYRTPALNISQPALLGYQRAYAPASSRVGVLFAIIRSVRCFGLGVTMSFCQWRKEYQLPQ